MNAPPAGTLSVLETRGFSGNPILTVLLGAMLGFCLMMAAILVGLPVFLSMGALFGGILLVYGAGAGTTVYQLSQEGIYRDFTPFGSKYGLGKTAQRFFPFTGIKYYKLDKDLSRSMNEVEKLQIQLMEKPFTLWITDQQDKAAFRAFADAFVGAVHQFNREQGYTVTDQPNVPETAAPVTTFTPPAAKAADPIPYRSYPAPIERRPGFYHTIFAKILTLVFTAISLLMLLATVGGTLPWSGIFRLLIFILPGTGYMIWRVFLKKDNSSNDR